MKVSMAVLLALTGACVSCAQVDSASFRADAAQQILTIAARISTGALKVDQLAEVLGAEIDSSVPAGRGSSLRSRFWRVEAIRQTQDRTAPVSEVTLLPEPSLHLTLQDLAAMGKPRTVRQSKTSTVVFERGGPAGAKVAVYVELKSAPTDARAPIVWIRFKSRA